MPETWARISEGSDFPPENLPFGVARIGDDAPRVVSRIGDHVIDLAAVGIAPDLTAEPTLNALMASGRDVRAEISSLLAGAPREDALHPVGECELLLPFEVADYVDSYSSIHHATNLGKILRPDSEPLMPNWRHIPVAYHGRAGSVIVSGTPIARPIGMLAGADGAAPSSGPSRSLDIELELGTVIGRGGARIAPDEADAHVFGFVLLNDWSARDIQAYEYQPLGPNLGKSFATTISPWVVTIDALRPFLVEAPEQDPPVDAYLRAARPWGLDLTLVVELNGEPICTTGFAGMYWTFAQQVAHMTVNGASARTGDLIGSGTVSGPNPGERGSLIEITWRGRDPITLPDGSTRTFLEDGDTVTLRGWAGGNGRPRIGFGEATGAITPAHPPAF
ncbi:MAG TPA: fumarylacetoacetase [Acidimicrobiales bacterium]|nr:fumarylacetoacetase [Acidimicrobiales bacterium]